MGHAATKLTYRDYLLLPDDGKRYEILDGDLYVTPSPVPRHQLITVRLTQALMNYLDIHPIGTLLTAPCDVLLGETDIVQPDLLFVRNGGAARITEKNIEGPPDLVVEILSPGTAGRDRELKRKRYEWFQVPEYWLIDPAVNTLEILRLDSGRYRHEQVAQQTGQVASPLFPDFTMSLHDLFK